MLASIHALAAAGNTSEYLRLKAEFDEIDKDTVVLSKDELAVLLSKAAISSPSKIEKKVYHTLDSSTLSEIVADLSNQKNPDIEEIRTVLKESGYQKDVVYEAVGSRYLPYEERVQIANEHAPDYFYLIAEANPERLFTENKEDFLAGLDFLVSQEEKDSTSLYQQSKFIEVLAKNASSSTDIDVAISRNPFGRYASQASTYIAASPFTTKDQAATILANEIATGGEDYWGARYAYASMVKETTGVVLEEPADFNYKIGPIHEAVPEELTKELNAVKEARKDSKRNHDLKESEEILQRIVDSYEPSFVALEKEYRHTEKFRSRDASELRRNAVKKSVVKGRLQSARTFLNQIADLERFQQELAKLP